MRQFDPQLGPARIGHSDSTIGPIDKQVLPHRRSMGRRDLHVPDGSAPIAPNGRRGSSLANEPHLYALGIVDARHRKTDTGRLLNEAPQLAGTASRVARVG